MQIKCFLSFVAGLALAGTTPAQNINVDVGPVGVIPTPAYGAAASQPGVWNPITSVALGTPQPLVNLSGTGIPATLTLLSGTQFDGTFNNAGTSGDDQQLMDDYQDGGTNPVWRFSNLIPGNYSIYTYAWAPDGAQYIDQVTVPGSIDPPQNCGGVWPGGHQLGITYTKHRAVVAAGGQIDVQITIVATYTTINGFQLRLEDTPSTPFCDGSVAGACQGCVPNNTGAPGRGCANSSFTAGTLLASSGIASLGADTLVLTTTDMPGPGLFFQANGLGSINPFGDGMLCASVGIIRMGVVFPTPTFTASYPGGLTPNPISIAGAPINPGDLKHYQVWYRDAIAFCSASTFNTTNGVSLTWAP